MGLTDSRSWNAGIDATYAINPDMFLMVGYVREYYTQLLLGQSCDLNNVTAFGITNNCVSHSTSTNISVQTNDRTVVDTFTAATRYAAIPDKLDLGLRYTCLLYTSTPEILVPTWIGADITPVTNPVHALSLIHI